MRKYILIFIVLFIFYYIFKYCNESKDENIKENFSQVNTTPSNPNQPIITNITPYNRSVTINWNPPIALIRGGWVKEYIIKSNPGNKTVSTSGDKNMAIVRDLNNGTAYTFTVRAISNKGFNQPPSNPSTPVTPNASYNDYVPPPPPPTPDQPRIKSIIPNNRSVTINWDPPIALTRGGWVKEYIVKSNPGNKTVSTSGDKNMAIVRDLINGTPYTFTIQAISNKGFYQAPSNPSTSVTPRATPNAPTNVSVSAVNGVATINWTASAPNGSVITGYIIKNSGIKIAETYLATPTSTTFNVISGTSYSLTVAPKYSGGPSDGGDSSIPYSFGSTFILPTAPTNVQGFLTNGALNGTVNLTWTQPTNMGAAIIGYRIKNNGTPQPNAMVLISGNTATVTVPNNQPYSLTLEAVYNNAQGIESYIMATNSLAITGTPTAPFILPTAPTNVQGFLTNGAQNGTVDLTWNQPTNMGASITGYRIKNNGTPQSNAIVSGNTARVTVPNDQFYSLTLEAKYNNAQGIESYMATNSPAITGTPTAPFILPSAPTNVQGSLDIGTENSMVQLTWDQPIIPGAAAITGYIIKNNGVVTRITNSDARTALVSVPNNQIYSLTLEATYNNAQGTVLSIMSTSPPITGTPTAPFILPTAPTNVQGFLTNGAQNGTVRLTWNQPIIPGAAAITGYIIRNNSATAPIASVGPNVTEITVDVPNDQFYSLTLEAVYNNAQGIESYIMATNSPAITGTPTTPIIPPSASTTVNQPEINTVEQILGTENTPTVNIVWTHTQNSNNPTSMYKISIIDANDPTNLNEVDVVSTASDNIYSKQITNLFMNDYSYYFTVTAINQIGEVVSNNSSDITILSHPNRPSISSNNVTVGNGSIRIRWTPPQVTDANDISAYRIRIMQTQDRTTIQNRLIYTATATRNNDGDYDELFNNLTNNTSYIVSIIAINSIGGSSPITFRNITPIETAPIQVEPFGNVSQTRTANSRTNKLPTGVYSSNNMSIYATIRRY